MTLSNITKINMAKLSCDEAMVLFADMRGSSIINIEAALATTGVVMFDGATRSLSKYGAAPSSWPHLLGVEAINLVGLGIDSSFDTISECLASYGYAVVSSVSSSLEYSSSHGENLPHFIAIAEEREMEYYIYDPVFKFEGWVSKDTINSSIASEYINKKFIGAFKIESVNIGEYINTFKRLIHRTFESSDEKSERSSFGLASILEFSDYVFGSDPNLISKEARNIEMSLGNISNSRFWQAEFISQIALGNENSEDLQLQFNEVSQDWRILSLMFMKGKMSGRMHEMKEKIRRKIEQIYDRELAIWSSFSSGSLD